MNCRYFFIVMLVSALLTGCAARPVSLAVPINPEATIDTLNSTVALSVKAGEKGLSGRGFLVMRYPDQFRLMILSPFGTTVAEIFLFGDELLYIDSSRNMAYRGNLADLPDTPALLGWRLLRWTTERVHPAEPGQEYLKRQREGGDWEYIDFDSQGLVLKKSIGGDEVRYDGYQSVAGIPVPAAIMITDRNGISIRITLDEPEVNTPLDEKAFIPALNGVTVLPLRQFPSQ